MAKASKKVTREQLLKNILKFPGYTAASHAEDFGVKPSELRAHLLSLTRAGEITSKGNTRAATWRAAK
jgi:predicted ArsR family transcriptional regulator